MQTIIKWINDNSVFLTTSAVLVFSLLTIIILLVSFFRSSKAKKQMRIMARSMQYSLRPRILPKYSLIDGKIRSLVFENVSTQYARNVIISLNSEWLQAKSALPDFQANNEILRELAGKRLIIAPNDRLVYALYTIGASSVEFFRSQPLKINIKYNDSNEKMRYDESFVLDLSVIDDSMPVASELANGLVKVTQSLEKLETALKDIDYRIYELGAINKRGLELNIKNFSLEDNDKKRKK